MDAALDIVESTLASLQERVEKQQVKKGEEGEKRVKDAATNTTPLSPLPPPSVTSSSELNNETWMNDEVDG